MTEPTEEQIKEACEKANALIRTIVPPNVLTKISVDPKTSYIDDAFVRLVMEHEAFRQRVSEIVRSVLAESAGSVSHINRRRLEPLVIPVPEPTPAEVLAAVSRDLRKNHQCDPDQFAEDLAFCLAKRGYHVAPIKEKELR